MKQKMSQMPLKLKDQKNYRKRAISRRGLSDFILFLSIPLNPADDFVLFIDAKFRFIVKGKIWRNTRT